MGGQAYSDAVRKAIFEAYCAAPYPTLEDLAQRFGPSLKTLLRWSKEQNWPQERERRQSSPARLDQALLKALSMTMEALESPDPTVRKEAVRTCYEISVIRQKTNTNQVDRGPIAVSLVADLSEFARLEIAKRTAPESRKMVTEVLAGILLDWSARVAANPEEVLA